jgi:hypothetical protein
MISVIFNIILKVGVIQMTQKVLLFSNEVTLEDGRMMKLDYNLTENESEEYDDSKHFYSESFHGCISPNYYGIQITKYLEDAIETDEVSGISYNKDTAISILKKLYHNEVTPVALTGILDD